MRITQFILSFAAAIFGPPDAPPNKDDQPKLKTLADHYFCCGTVEATGHGSGTECRKTDEGEANLCAHQLCCKAGYLVDNYVTTCTAPSQRGRKTPAQFCCESAGTDNAGHLPSPGPLTDVVGDPPALIPRAARLFAVFGNPADVAALPRSVRVSPCTNPNCPTSLRWRSPCCPSGYSLDNGVVTCPLRAMRCCSRSWSEDAPAPATNPARRPMGNTSAARRSRRSIGSGRTASPSTSARSRSAPRSCTAPKIGPSRKRSVTWRGRGSPPGVEELSRFALPWSPEAPWRPALEWSRAVFFALANDRRVLRRPILTEDRRSPNRPETLVDARACSSFESRAHDVAMQRYLVLTFVLVGACDWYDRPCYESTDVECRDDTEPCVAADDETGGAECTPFDEPAVVGEIVSCSGVVSEIEVMGDDAANQYGVTDYAFESGSTSLAGLIDFQPTPEAIATGTDPWATDIRSALPGVVTHEGYGGVPKAGYFSRVCCPQVVLEGTLAAPPESPTCSSSGYTLNHVPNAWCLAMDEGAGLCVYPCDHDSDCPEPAREFCDLSTPEPYGLALGTCRYKSMPTVPTAHEDIDP